MCKSDLPERYLSDPPFASVECLSEAKDEMRRRRKPAMPTMQTRRPRVSVRETHKGGESHRGGWFGVRVVRSHPPSSTDSPTPSGGFEALKLTLQTFASPKSQYRAPLRRSSPILGTAWAPPTVHLQFTNPHHSHQTYSHKTPPLLPLLRLPPMPRTPTRPSSWSTLTVRINSRWLHLAINHNRRL